MNENVNNNMNIRNLTNEYDFLLLVSIIKNSIKDAVIFGLLGLSISAIYVYFLKPNYEAIAVLNFPNVYSINNNSHELKPILDQQDFKQYITVIGNLTSEISTECGLNALDAKNKSLDKVFQITTIPGSTKNIINISPIF